MACVTGIPRATNYKCPLQNAPGFSAANGRIIWLTRLWLLYQPTHSGDSMANLARRTGFGATVSSAAAVATLPKLTHENLSQKIPRRFARPQGCDASFDPRLASSPSYSTTSVIGMECDNEPALTVTVTG